MVVADDLGYTDLGVYGGEIETPNLDRLARAGLILTDFHNEAVCGPTRASILAGTDNRNAGGAMHQTPNQIGVPGYESHLSRNVVPFSDLLQQSGYSTYFLGKWHLGSEPDLLPTARGFDRSYALMEGSPAIFMTKGRFDPTSLAPITGMEKLSRVFRKIFSRRTFTLICSLSTWIKTPIVESHGSLIWLTRGAALAAASA